MQKKDSLFLSVFLLISVMLISCHNGEKHFISDKNYRESVHNDFLSRKNIAKGRTEALFSIFNNHLSLFEKESLEFLYAYMPLSDLADYDGDYFLEQVRYSFIAKSYFSWGKTIPEDIFRHFVLVYRVNNENLDSARKVIFNEVRERIKGLSMYEATLEINHWCHEKVAYRPSDIRTSSPLATIKTAYGRCGEESTFTVAALRAVCIPARQCYTPRWAHTDDNHAWVEVWIDGKWYYLGACEPEPLLNISWFDIPATRTMMVHSNVFGKYNGIEEVNNRTNLSSKINMLSNYAKTKKITITVVDSSNNSVEDATVLFKLYNYSEFYPIATQNSNSNGIASITTGMGDLLVWAKKNALFGFEQINVREKDSVTVTLGKPKINENLILNFHLTPPCQQSVNNSLTEEQIKENIIRLKQENKIRENYLHSFPSQQQIAKITNENLSAKEIKDIILKSEGNYAEIEKLLNMYSKKDNSLFLNEFFLSLSDKDYRDGVSDILKDHITHYDKNCYPVDTYLKGIISPRIANEGLRAWRSYLSKNMPKLLNGNISADNIEQWINSNILVDNQSNYFNCPISPVGVFELKIADASSIDIFFVAACRSLNIPAYKDNATGLLYVWTNNKWKLYNFNKEPQSPENAKLILTFKGDKKKMPKYYSQYTIAKEIDGDYITFDYENDESKSIFPVTFNLSAGNYLLTTGNRYLDGDVLARMEFFSIKQGETVNKELIIIPLEYSLKSYGKINLNKQINNNTTTVKSFMNNSKLIICFIDMNTEPTKHLLKEIAAYVREFESCGNNFLFIFSDLNQYNSFNSKEWNLPKNSIKYLDNQNKWFNEILKSNSIDFENNFPVVYVIDNKGNIVFKSEGYRIGTGALLYRTILQ